MTPILPISSTFSNITKPMSKTKWSNNASDPHTVKKNESLDVEKEMPWLKNKTIAKALTELKTLEFDSDDIKYLKNLGVNLPYQSGAEAINFIEKQNIRILFDSPTAQNIHAQYDFGKNTVIINERYKNTQDFATILAISEAILHEAGHAKDNDGDSSIQEEIDFLGMNAIAHRAFLKKYGNIFSDSNEPIIKDGVSLYAKLFFEPDPEKQKLIQRITEKYGDLPSGDRMHPPGAIARAVKRQFQA